MKFASAYTKDHIPELMRSTFRASDGDDITWSPGDPWVLIRVAKGKAMRVPCGLVYLGEEVRGIEAWLPPGTTRPSPERLAEMKREIDEGMAACRKAVGIRELEPSAAEVVFMVPHGGGLPQPVEMTPETFEKLRTGDVGERKLTRSEQASKAAKAMHAKRRAEKAAKE